MGAFPSFEPWHLLVYAGAFSVLYIFVALPVGEWFENRAAKRRRAEQRGEVQR